jgi:hypothetical protein
MSTVVLTFPELGFIAGTRGMLGAGIGLLASLNMSEVQRRSVGIALVAIGLATTIPAAWAVFGHRGELDRGSDRPAFPR